MVVYIDEQRCINGRQQYIVLFYMVNWLWGTHVGCVSDTQTNIIGRKLYIKNLQDAYRLGFLEVGPV